MRQLMPLVLMLAGCGGAVGGGGDDIPPKPTCDYDEVLELMAGPDACPDGYEWIASWARPGGSNPEVTLREYFPVGEDPGAPWAFEGETCAKGGEEMTGEAASSWRCEGDLCRRYRYRLVDGETVESNDVRCTLEDDGGLTVTLERTTTEPGAEPLRERFIWLPGSDQGTRRGDPVPQT